MVDKNDLFIRLLSANLKLGGGILGSPLIWRETLEKLEPYLMFKKPLLTPYYFVDISS
jgi:hypothetical protein